MATWNPVSFNGLSFHSLTASDGYTFAVVHKVGGGFTWAAAPRDSFVDEQGNAETLEEAKAAAESAAGVVS